MTPAVTTPSPFVLSEVEARAASVSPGTRPSTSLRTSAETAQTAPSTAEQQKLRQVAEQFEAVLVRQMIGAMRSAELADGMFDSSATQQFRDMADAKTAETMAHQGALGIADLLVKQYGARLTAAASSDSSSTVRAEPVEARVPSDPLGTRASTSLRTNGVEEIAQ